MPRRVLHDRREPDEHCGGGDPDRREGSRKRNEIRPSEDEAHDREAAERDEQKERIGRMDQREGKRARRQRRDQRQPRRPDEEHRQAHDGRDDQLTGGRRREVERVVGAAVPRRERDERDLAGQHREASPRRVEEGSTGLEGEQERERHEDRGLVEEHVGRVDPGEPADEREEPVPERERIPRMRSTVGELGDGVQREVVELRELPDPGEVEERVPLEGRPEAPDRDREQGAGREHAPAEPVAEARPGP